MDLDVPADHSTKMKENEKINKHLDLGKELNAPTNKEKNKQKINKLWNMRVKLILILVGLQGLGKKIGGIGNQRKNRDQTDNIILKIG